jgi:hypothetical protein
LSHHSSDPDPRLASRWIPKATHGVALLLGILIWNGRHSEQVTNESQPAEAARKQVRPDAASQAGAWINAKLARLREPDPASETEPASMAEFLEQNRKETAKWRKERNDDLDRYVAQADRMRGPAAPGWGAPIRSQKSY